MRLRTEFFSTKREGLDWCVWRNVLTLTGTVRLRLRVGPRKHSSAMFFLTRQQLDLLNLPSSLAAQSQKTVGLSVEKGVRSRLRHLQRYL